MREAVAELAILAHVIIDARNGGSEALIGGADLVGTAAELVAVFVGATVIGAAV